MARTDTHVTKIHLVDTPEMEGIAASTIQRLMPGLKLWLFESKTERGRYTPEQYAALVRHHHAQVFGHVAAFVQGFDEPHLKRAAVFAALFETFNKLPSKAHEFWQPVADGLGLERKSDPRYKLRELLQNVMVRYSSGADHKRVVDAEALYRICVTAWNKWRAGEETQAALRPTKKRMKAR